jgi:hypothetical protein
MLIFNNFLKFSLFLDIITENFIVLYYFIFNNNNKIIRNIYIHCYKY